ncbi:MAG: hypothetical protein ACE5K7_00105 [Phycisphaerae bacterium]
MAVLTLASLTPGCTSWHLQRSYRQIHLDQTSAQQAAATMPRPVLATPAGLSYYKHRRLGPNETRDALVVLLAGTSRARAKLLACLRNQRFAGLTRQTALLQAELPGHLKPKAGHGPIAQLQAALDELARRPFDKSAVQAQALVAAGLIRILQAIPGVAAPQSLEQRFAAQLKLIPPDGQYQISSSSSQSFTVRYHATSVSR